MALLNFKASDIAVEDRPNTYTPIPPGEYEVIITRSDTKPTKTGDGSYLELEMQIVSGDLSGRRYWERLNLDNPSQQTVTIAQQQLARLCAALGMDEVTDSEQLHDKPVIAIFAISKKDPTRNSIYGYRAISGPPVSPAKLAAAKPAAAQAKPAARPWG